MVELYSLSAKVKRIFLKKVHRIYNVSACFREDDTGDDTRAPTSARPAATPLAVQWEPPAAPDARDGGERTRSDADGRRPREERGSRGHAAE